MGKSLRKLVFVLWCAGLCLPYYVKGQQSMADSLHVLLQSPVHDTTRALLLVELGWENMDTKDSARHYFRSALGVAASAKFRKAEAQALNGLGVMAAEDSDYGLALQLYEKALAIREEIGDYKGVASLQNNIANLYEAQGKYAEALKLHRQNLQTVRQMGDSVRIARALYNIGMVHVETRDLELATTEINDYRLFVEQMKDDDGLARAYNALGNIRFEAAQFHKAADWYLKVLDMAQNGDNPTAIASAYNNYANALAESYAALPKERREERKEYILDLYHCATEILTAQDDQDALANVYRNIADYHKNNLKDYVAAEAYLYNSAKYQTDIDSDANALKYKETLGDIFYKQGKIKESLKMVLEYQYLAEEIKDSTYLQKSYKDLSKVYAALGNYKFAHENRIKYEELYFRFFDLERTRILEQREVLYSDEKKQIEIERQERDLQLKEAELEKSRLMRNSLTGGALALGLVTLLLFNRNRIRARANKDLSEKNAIIEKERQRADDLLHNILPESTAAELKQYNAVKPVRYESVTVLFTDFKSFTTIAEQMPPEELVQELDTYFRVFDSIMERYGVEKIKTIGDAYMCVGGLPIPNISHPMDVVSAGLEMQRQLMDIMEKRRSVGKPIFEMRVGIHTGPVVAGVVGSHKFAYDIWGDAVNTASRMESSGEPGRVNISASTYELVKNQFECSYRGEIAAKNKGNITMYFVGNRK